MEKNKESQGDANVVWVFLAIAIGLFAIFSIGSYFVHVTHPEDRENQLKYAVKTYPFLKEPQKGFKNLFEEKERSVVFIRNGLRVRYIDEEIGAGDVRLAILYAAEVEAKVGKQDWLDEAYKSYTLTRKEMGRLASLNSAYEEKLRYQRYGDLRDLKKTEDMRAVVQYNRTTQDILKSRQVLVAMNP